MDDMTFAYLCFALALAGALASIVLGVIYNAEWRWRERSRRYTTRA